jgi:hypothetical protein
MWMSVKINGNPAPPINFESPGQYNYSTPIPAGAGAELLVECELNRALPPRPHDPRELGVIVSKLEVA